MPPIDQQSGLRVHNTTAFPLEVATPSSPQQTTATAYSTTMAAAVSAGGAAIFPSSPKPAHRKRSSLVLQVTRADGETLVFLEDRKRRKRGGSQEWSVMLLTPAHTGTAAAAHGRPSDSTSTLDGSTLTKSSWPLRAFYDKVRGLSA